MKRIIILSILLLSLAACSKLILKPADFSWPIESALKIDDKGNVSENRFSFNLNVSQLFQLEAGEKAEYAGKEIRIIKDYLGYYYVTSQGFKNVFVLLQTEGGLAVENKILIDEKGIDKPVFNQKNTNIELLANGKTYKLNNKGIEGK